VLEKGIKSEILQTKKVKTAWMPETLLSFLFPIIWIYEEINLVCNNFINI
jgi:hypothetical protein